MGIGAGLGAQVGIATESTPGTAVAVTTFTRFNSETLIRRPNVVQGMGFPAPLDGVALAARRGEATHDAGGPLEFFVPTKGIGKWLQHCLGSYGATAVQQASSAAYQQIHNVGTNDGVTFTCQVGVPSIDGTVNPKTLSGCKITDWELTADANANLKLALTIDAMDIAPTGAGALALQAASFSTGSGLWDFHHATVKSAAALTTPGGLWTPTSPASLGVVRKFSLKGGWPKDAARWGAGLSTKAEALGNDFQPLTGSVDVDFASMALYNQHAANTSSVLQVQFTGANIASTYYYGLGFTMPAAYLEQGSTPVVNGAGVVTVTYPLTFLNDTTNGSLQAVVMSTDTTV